MKFIKDVDKKRFTEFSYNHKKSHFLQSYNWGKVAKFYRDQDPVYLGLEDDNGCLIATCLLIVKKLKFGYSYGYIPRGITFDYDDLNILTEFTKDLKVYAKNNKIVYITMDPDIKYQDIDENGNGIPKTRNDIVFDKYVSLGYKHKGFHKLYEGNQPRYTFRIDLDKSWDEVEEKMSKTFLKSVRRSYNYDLIINNDKNAEEFVRLQTSITDRNKFKQRGVSYYQEFTNIMEDDCKYFNALLEPQKILDKINNEISELNDKLKVSSKKAADINAKIERLEKDKEIFNKIEDEKVVVCSLICVYTANKAWSLYIGSDELANETFAISRCYYEAIKDAHNKKLKIFDLFGTVGDPKTTYHNLAKLHDFKRKFGDEYIEFIGEFDLIQNKLVYKMLPLCLKIGKVYRKLLKKRG